MTNDEKHKILTDYLKMKVDDKDWHGVSDAANDLRVLEASLGPPKFLVQGGIRVKETVIDGKRYIEVCRE